jgi:hypothetical protein
MRRIETEALWEGIVNRLQCLGYGIRLRESLYRPLSNGYVNHGQCEIGRNGKVTLKLQDLGDMAYSAAHELGHILNTLGDSGPVKEIKAESFAYLFLQKFGRDRIEEAIEYIAGWTLAGDIAGREDCEEFSRGVHDHAKVLAKKEARAIWKGLKK